MKPTFLEIKAMTKTQSLGASGLWLRVVKLKDGYGRYYIFRRRDSLKNPINCGKEIQVVIGSIDRITYSEARAKSADLFAKVLNGINPIIASRKNKLTLGELFAQWQDIDEKKKHHANPKKTKRDAQGRIKHLGAFVDTRADSVTVATLSEAMRDMWVSRPDSAQKLQRELHSAFAWAMRTGIINIERNPADAKSLEDILGTINKTGNHHPKLPAERVPCFMASLLRRRPSASSLLIAYAILTTQRTGTVYPMTTASIQDGISGKVHFVPRSQMKRKDEYRGDRFTPLSKQALSILEKIQSLKDAGAIEKSDFVFSNSNGEPLSDTAIKKILNKMDSEQKAIDGIGWVDPNQKDQQGNPKRMTVHGTARASFTEWARENIIFNHPKFAKEDWNFVLDHAQDKIEEAYSRGQSESNMRMILDAWGEFCFSKIPKD